MPLSLAVSSRIGGRSATIPLPRRVAAILRKFGADAHMFMPGVGYMNGFQAGNYLESTGNTNASVDGAVGLVLDAAGSVGPDVYPSGLAGASVSGGASVAGAVASLPNASAQVGAVGYAAVAGMTYRVTLDVVSSAGSYLNVYIGSAGVFGAVSGAFTGRKTVHIKANNTAGLIFQNDTGSVGGIPSITLVECKPVTGTHATQTTTANKPTLRRGILNQALWSGDFSNSAWIKQSLNLSAAGDNPPTGSTGQLLTSTGSFAATAPASPIAASAGQSVTMAFEVKAGAGATVATLVDETQGGTCYAQITLATGVVGAAGFVTSASSVDLGNGWWLVAATYTVQAGKTSVLPRSWVGAYSGANTAGQSIKVGRVGLFQGALTAQQILAAGGIPLTTTAPVSSQYGAYAWQFDGSNDVLALPGPLFQMADDHCVVTAVSLNATSGVLQDIFSQRGATATPIVCEIVIPATTTRPVATWRDDAGTLLQLDSGTAIGLNTPTVISAQKVGNTETIEINGVQKASSNTVFGVASVTTAALGNYSGASTNQPLNGFLYPTIAIKGTVTPAEKKLLTKFLGSIAGVSIA